MHQDEQSKKAKVVHDQGDPTKLTRQFSFLPNWFFDFFPLDPPPCCLLHLLFAKVEPLSSGTLHLRPRALEDEVEDLGRYRPGWRRTYDPYATLLSPEDAEKVVKQQTKMEKKKTKAAEKEEKMKRKAMEREEKLRRKLVKRMVKLRSNARQKEGASTKT